MKNYKKIFKKGNLVRISNEIIDSATGQHGLLQLNKTALRSVNVLMIIRYLDDNNLLCVKLYEKSKKYCVRFKYKDIFYYAKYSHFVKIPIEVIIDKHECIPYSYDLINTIYEKHNELMKKRKQKRILKRKEKYKLLLKKKEKRREKKVKYTLNKYTCPIGMKSASNYDRTYIHPGYIKIYRG